MSGAPRILITLLCCLAKSITVDVTVGLALPPAPMEHTYRIIRSLPHNPEAFTEGLCIADGFLYEGTGLEGASSVCRLDLSTGKLLKSVLLPSDLFGEGVTVMGDRLFQLTWTSRLGIIYSKNDLRKLGDFSYSTEGWGLTQDGHHLIMSDGTDVLYFLDPGDFEVRSRIHVTDDKGPVQQLNELEFAMNRIFANIWKSDRIAVIHPKTGVVTDWIDLAGLYTRQTGEPQPEVLNGIAYDVTTQKLYVTGKLWKRIFEIRPFPELEN
jgi:glutaminyl-peptide cyclotransferase